MKNEIESYQDESLLWITEQQLKNSAGNLCLHIVGNLNTYIGAEIGKTNYVRNRELEFSAKNIPKDVLIEKIEDTITVVNESLDKLTEADMTKSYPLLVLETKTTYAFFLVHLSSHLSYHLGQITYHRRFF